MLRASGKHTSWRKPGYGPRRPCKPGRQELRHKTDPPCRTVTLECSCWEKHPYPIQSFEMNCNFGGSSAFLSGASVLDGRSRAGGFGAAIGSNFYRFTLPVDSPTRGVGTIGYFCPMCVGEESRKPLPSVHFPLAAGRAAGPERTRISCCAAPDRTACAAFFKESRMEFDKATNLDRKSGLPWRF